LGVTPEDRAKAIAEHVGPLPRPVREELERVVTSAIRLAVKRALNEQLAKLEREAETKANSADGRGKQRKGRDPAAIMFHSEWARRFHYLRTGQTLPDPTDLLGPEIIVGEIR
jgi:hypothetical protein